MTAQVWRIFRRRLPEGIAAYVVDDTGEIPIVVIDPDAPADSIAQIKTGRSDEDKNVRWVLWWWPAAQPFMEAARRLIASGGQAGQVTVVTFAAVATVATAGTVELALAPPAPVAAAPAHSPLNRVTHRAVYAAPTPSLRIHRQNTATQDEQEQAVPGVSLSTSGTASPSPTQTPSQSPTLIISTSPPRSAPSQRPRPYPRRSWWRNVIRPLMQPSDQPTAQPTPEPSPVPEPAPEPTLLPEPSPTASGDGS